MSGLAGRASADVMIPPGFIDLSGNGIVARRAFGTFSLSRNVAIGGLGPRRAFGTFVLSRTVSMTGLGPRRAFGAFALIPGNVNVAPPSLGPRREFGTHAIRRTINFTGQSAGPRRAFGTHTLVPGNVNVAPPSLGPRRAFGTALFSRYVSLPSVGPRRAFGTQRVRKEDLAERRRLERVAADMEFEDDPLRRFALVGESDGSFAYGPRGKFFDYDAELRENEIQTADDSVAEGIEDLGVFVEVEAMVD